MLAGKGFSNVINLTGGIKAWNGRKAIGDLEQGMSLFSGKESPEETLVVAYSLEAGLRECYLEMMQTVKNEKVRALFEKLSAIEAKHQQRVYEAYRAMTGTRMDEEEFAREKVFPAMEGGLTTKEYLTIYQPDLEMPVEVISFAMAIEAQALDLYQRAAERAELEESKKALMQIAEEERTHLELLGGLMEA
jgi:rubrerythrin